ncbi:MAG: hypothetical protein ACLU6Y_08985 [Ruminococcus sp.]
MIATLLISRQNNDRKRIRTCIGDDLPDIWRTKIFAGRRGILYISAMEAFSLRHQRKKELRACGLGYRAKHISVTARSIASGEISLEKIYDMRVIATEQKRTDETLRGVGEK